MKKIGFPLFLIGVVIIPLLCIYLADKNGVITDPKQSESMFAHFISQSYTKNLPPEDKNLLIDLFNQDTTDLVNPPKGLSSKAFKDGSFLCNFYNNILERNSDWYELSFGIRPNGDHYSIKIKTGIFEKILFYKFESGEKTVLLEHYIPLRQNKENSFQIDIIGKHIIIMCNRRIFFHILLKNEIGSGAVNLDKYITDNQRVYKVQYAPIPEDIEARMIEIISAIPSFTINN